MNILNLSCSTLLLNGNLNITGSKSESNRLLILQALTQGAIEVTNVSNSHDTQVLQKALAKLSSTYTEEEPTVIDIYHAGTAMRFLTAFLSIQEGREFTLTGSKRMQERPIAPLVDALKQLGADITYQNQIGYPPLSIKGKKITLHKVEMPGNISSQFLSALLLIGPFLPNGLELRLTTEITSRPYLEMTLQLLHSLGANYDFQERKITVLPLKEIKSQIIAVESDWSSASYFYSIMALAQQNSQITLSTYKSNSLQGDAQIVQLYEKYFGVKTDFQDNQIVLSKIENHKFPDAISLDLNHIPDMAQTLVNTCAALKIKGHFTGLHTLRIKETDRLQALQTELKKLGVHCSIGADFLSIDSFATLNQTPIIQTYQDHRMAMSFAPWALLGPISFENPEVVEKSYPDFWTDMQKIGFGIV